MGKLFKNIPFERAVLYLLLVPLIPLFALGFDYFTKQQEIKSIEMVLSEVENQKIRLEQKQALNNRLRSYYANSESLFLEKKLSSLKFLNKERQATEELKKKIAIPIAESFEKRYEFLTGEQNRLHFVASDHILQEGIQETLFTLKNPVEIDAQDLKEILSRVENREENQPQLIVTQFTLNKKTTGNQTEVYELQLQLLQREFTE
jgi:hypothetical protein